MRPSTCHVNAVQVHVFPWRANPVLSRLCMQDYEPGFTVLAAPANYETMINNWNKRKTTKILVNDMEVDEEKAKENKMEISPEDKELKHMEISPEDKELKHMERRPTKL